MMIDGLDEAYRTRLCQALERFPKVTRGVLFGSRALGTHRGSSDIDLALEGPGLELQDILAIMAKIEDLNLPVEVDLVMRSKIRNPALEEHIRTHGIECYHKPAEQDAEADLKGAPRVADEYPSPS